MLQENFENTITDRKLTCLNITQLYHRFIIYPKSLLPLSSYARQPIQSSLCRWVIKHALRMFFQTLIPSSHLIKILSFAQLQNRNEEPSNLRKPIYSSMELLWPLFSLIRTFFFCSQFIPNCTMHSHKLLPRKTHKKCNISENSIWGFPV